MSRSVVDEAVSDVRAQLGPDEVIRIVVQGGGAQFMVGTDRRVFVWKKGWLAGATFGQKLASWDYRNITGIHMNTGLVSDGAAFWGCSTHDANIVGAPAGRSGLCPDHLRSLATMAIHASVRLHCARREAVGACTGERSTARHAHRQTRAPTPRPRAG